MLQEHVRTHRKSAVKCEPENCSLAINNFVGEKKGQANKEGQLALIEDIFPLNRKVKAMQICTPSVFFGNA